VEEGIKSIIILLLTQAMIFLGEIPNPITGEKSTDVNAASRYIHMLSALNEKTKGNLDETEKKLLIESIDNLNLVCQKKMGLNKG